MTDKNKENPKQHDPDHVALIEDPYGIRTLEISHAQEMSEELDLDDEELLESSPADLEEAASEWKADAETEAQAETQLANLEKAMVEEQKKQVEELEAAAADDESLKKQAEEELARQIAEDQALEAQLKAEQEAADAEMDEELKAALPQKDEHGQLDVREVESCIETLLFMSDKPVSVNKLQEMLGPDFNTAIFQEAITSLMDRYKGVHHGIEVVPVGGGFQFRTKPGRAALAKKLAKVQTQRLSSGGMETLAIVAYRQPVLKDDIDKIRGVDSSYFIRGLLDKKLIRIAGRSELPGRPLVYGTTDEFLQLFGLKDLSSMPPLHELEAMIPSSESKNPEDEDPRVREMRRLVGQMKADTSTSLIYDHREDEKILKDIRERVGSITTTTPYLEEQKAAEKAAAEALKRGQLPVEEPAPGQSGELPFEAVEHQDKN